VLDDRGATPFLSSQAEQSDHQASLLALLSPSLACLGTRLGRTALSVYCHKMSTGLKNWFSRNLAEARCKYAVRRAYYSDSDGNTFEVSRSNDG
jgi:hypothetical protein